MAVGSSSAAPNHDRVVAPAPAAGTPAVNDGQVEAITQVGNTVVVGGNFSSITPPGGSATNRNYLFAFDATTGALRGSFSPQLNGPVKSLVPGPTAGTVYAGGSFSQVNGASSSRVTLLNISNGAVTSGFRAAALNGVVNSLARSGNRLYVGGNFSTAGGTAHAGLASLNATTGALDSFVGNQVSERHNDSGSGAQGAVGVRGLDVSADGTRLVAIGNFKKVDGLDRDQVVLLSLGGSSAQVTADWQTNRYKPYCFNWAFDTYVRGVSFSPDGSYFVVASTGGHNGGTLCDTAARFETNASGNDIQPTWVDYSGGDTLWGVTVTEEAVYVGGHQRWMNNSLAGDYAGPGAVPRAGIAALDPDTGMPLKWNPGRNPRGAAVYALFATSEGLWMGSDTEYIGNRYQYKRPRLAFFPLAGGAPVAADATTNLPGTAYLGAGSASGNGNVLYRVNAGGPSLPAVDNGPDWSSDDGWTSPYRNDGSNAAGWGSGATIDPAVPATTPPGIYDSERWSPSDNPAMNWAFAAPNGVPLQVRMYFANRCGCTSAPGSRVFDVRLDGQLVLDDLDLVAQDGDQRGSVRTFDITSDGTVNIDFSHVVENPLINGIEIVRRDMAPPASTNTNLQTIGLTASGADPASEVQDGGIDWAAVRGSFVAGGKLWYGKANGTFNWRSFNNGQFGAENSLDPYNDPDWADVSTGSGNTFDGQDVALYGQMSSVTGMAYSGGKLYYTRSGDSNLYWRWFSTDSGIIGADQFTANGGRNWNNTMGMFASSGNLYFVDRSDGTLNRMQLTGSGPTGSSTVVDNPASGGNDWRGKALFLGETNTPPANEAPVADFDSSCVDLICSLDGSSSADPDGTIASHHWEFGDGDTANGQIVNHEYDAAGTYPVTLTVTDNDGDSDSVTKNVIANEPSTTNPISFVGSRSASANVRTPSVPLPAGVQAGDTLVLLGSLSNATSADVPSGWTLRQSDVTASLESYVWTRTATAADAAGGSVTVTMDAVHKSALVISAYRGVNASSPIASIQSSTDVSTDSHTTPTVTAPSGSWVVSAWTDKGPSTSNWTLPAGHTRRGDAYSTGSGRVSAVIADRNGPSSGVVDGVTATTDAVSSRAVNFTIVLAPQ